MCPKIKIKPIRHRDCQSSLTLCSLLTKSRQLFSAKFQALAKLVYSPCDGVPGNRKRAEGHLDGFDRVGLLVHFRARSQTPGAENAPMIGYSNQVSFREHDWHV